MALFIIKIVFEFSDINRIYIKESVCEALSDLSTFKTLKVLPDIYFDLFGKILHIAIAIIVLNSETITLYCADLINPFSCLVYSCLRKKNDIKIYFLYDGTLNLVMATPNIKHRLFDHIRNAVFASLYNVKYPRKKRFLTGLDLDTVTAQLCK